MTKRMSAKEARANFSDLLGSVYYTKEPVIIEKQGKPFAVVISPEQYVLLEKELERAWATIDKIRERNADKTEEEVMAHVTSVVEAVRQEMYERQKGVAKGRS